MSTPASDESAVDQAPDRSQDPSADQGSGRNRRRDRIIVLLIVLGSVTVLPLAMMAPAAVLTRFPLPVPKTEAQLVADKMDELGVPFDAASYKRGQAIFTTTCVACHMPDGGARPKLGKDVVHSTFTAGQTDSQLMMFLMMGRNPGDPLNTTGVGMPPKGGNPALTTKDLTDVITFIRGRQAMEGVAFQR